MKHFVIGLNLIRKYQKYLWVMDGKLKKKITKWKKIEQDLT